MFCIRTRWSAFLTAVFCIVLGLQLLLPLRSCSMGDDSEQMLQKYTWAVAPQDEKIDYRRYGYDVCRRKDDHGATIMYLKKGDEIITTSLGVETDRYNRNGSLEMDRYGIVSSWNSERTRYSYAGVISLDRWSRDGFYNADPDAPFYLASAPSRWGYVNRQGFWVVQLRDYEHATQFTEKHAVFSKGSVLHILNLDGSTCPCGDWSKEMEIPLQEVVHDGMLLLRGPAGYCYLNVDENSHFPADAGYEDARRFGDGLAAVKENGLWGYINREGHYVIPPRYSDAFAFSNGYAYVIDQNGQGLVIDHAGETVSSTIGTFAEAEGYADGLFKVSVGYRENLVDLEGKLHLPGDGVHDLVYENGVWCAYPPMGHSIIPFARIKGGIFLPQCRKYIEYTRGDRVTIYETVVVMSSDNKSTLYDKATGEVLYQCRHISPFSEGLAVAKKGRRETFINMRGRELFQPQAVTLGNFSDGLAAITLANGQTGMIANPLIYDAWAEEESVRATALGIEPIPAEFLHYGDLWDRLAVVSDRVYAARMTFQMGDAARYQVDVSVIRSALEQNGYPSEGVVDREHLAVALKALASEYGLVTDGFLLFYGDADEVTDGCESAMAYISTLCLFDMDGSNILPQKPVSGSEGQAYLLRFFERMLDQAP